MTTLVRAPSLPTVQFDIAVSHQLDDPEWDAFLTTIPGVSYAQTSLWAQAKDALGYRVARVILRRGKRIVGGAQMLIRQFAFGQAFGYVPLAPVLRRDHPGWAKQIVEELCRVARTEDVQFLAVQPPGSGAVLGALGDCGFRPSSLELAPTATCLIDLSDNLDDIFSQIQTKTRRNIRFGERNGIAVREGAEQDIPVFYRLHAETARRQGFSAYPEDYYFSTWQAFAPARCAALFIAEFEGDPLATLFVIAFGDKVTDWKAGWSGAHGSCHPNEVTRWAAIKWAKSHGFHFYDIGGMRRDAVLMILRGETMPRSVAASAHFKLQFGGEPVLFPQASIYVCNSSLRWAYRKFAPEVAAPVALNTLINWCRRRQHKNRS
ncbi:MAG: peptidoglycan bridge formation glycyltransferase FemA/FemB family protein [Terriglobia bacterium]|jgi:lipid II:glycine glycyltransferase (peptidoglycan interpeptide bridge formation enzyme)